MQLKIDLHVHTIASEDGCSTISEIVKAGGARGLDGLAITDHDCQFSPETAASVTNETGFLVIPGVEVTTDLGHLLVLSPKRGFARLTPFQEVVRSALIDGSVVIVPHPNDPISHGVGEDAVKAISEHRTPLEVLNSSTMMRYNERARRLAGQLSLPVTAGSDAHLAKAVGDAFTMIEAEQRTVQSVLDAIRKGNTKPEGGLTPKMISVETILARLRKRARLK